MRLQRAATTAALCGLLLWMAPAGLAPAAQATDLAARVHTATLDNGLRVIMVVRDHAPIIHFTLMFDVGGVDEPPGLGGIAHMVEHMAFKGTRSVGSLDPDEELRRLADVERVNDALSAAREAARQDPARDAEVAELESAFAAARQAAQELAIPDVLDRIFDVHGGVGYNASTGYDRTSYAVSLPANRLELWARLQADMLRDAVFRFFYEEVDVVKKERRQRNEDDPTGYLMEHFLGAALAVHPYGRPRHPRVGGPRSGAV